MERRDANQTGNYGEHGRLTIEEAVLRGAAPAPNTTNKSPGAAETTVVTSGRSTTRQGAHKMEHDSIIFRSQTSARVSLCARPVSRCQREFFFAGRSGSVYSVTGNTAAASLANGRVRCGFGWRGEKIERKKALADTTRVHRMPINSGGRSMGQRFSFSLSFSDVSELFFRLFECCTAPPCIVAGPPSRDWANN